MNGNWQKKALVAAVLLVVAVNVAILWRVVMNRPAAPDLPPPQASTPTSNPAATAPAPAVATAPGTLLERTEGEAEKGDLRAQLQLAQWYAQGSQGATQDVARALQWYRKAADQGSAEAQLQAGRLLQEGTRELEDLEAALDYLRKAADQGQTNAIPLVRTVGAKLESARQSREQASALAKQVAQESKLKAVYQRGLANLLSRNGPPDYAAAYKAFEEAAEGGYGEAQLNLGLMYVSGQGVTKNYGEAAKWFEKAAIQGLADAQFNLAILYATGQGVARDYAESAKWVRKAAEQGQMEGQYNLGVLLSTGQGVTQDYQEAATWLRKAADQGHPASQSNLGVFYIQGRGVETNAAEAFKWFERAAKQGNATAQFNLGVMYSKGQGVATNLTESYYWSALAALQGDKEAEANRDLAAMDLRPRDIAAILKRVSAFRPQRDSGPNRGSYLKLELPQAAPVSPFGTPPAPSVLSAPQGK